MRSRLGGFHRLPGETHWPGTRSGKTLGFPGWLFIG